MPKVLRSVAIELKGAKELQALREAGAVARDVLAVVAEHVRVGVSTQELDEVARREVLRRKARPAFLGYRGFPAVLCTSVNDEVVHGIPKAERLLREGDIVSLDFGCLYRGFYGDCAVTLPVGRVSGEALRLLRVTREALEEGIDRMRPDGRLGDVSAAIQRHVESSGFSVVREFVGHGIGRALHEDPAVPNHGEPGTGLRLQPGLVLAIEPMVNAGGPDVRILDDRWTAVATDGTLSAHFEHMVAVTERGPEVLTRED
jgi:methionyl aminopeptidase